jgi:hypothetical protein
LLKFTGCLLDVKTNKQVYMNMYLDGLPLTVITIIKYWQFSLNFGKTGFEREF